MSMGTREGLGRQDCLGLVHPGLDIHTLGISTIAGLVQACGIRVRVADRAVCLSLEAPEEDERLRPFLNWVRDAGLTALGFSHRLDPEAGARHFAQTVERLRRARLLAPEGPVRHVYFAGLPETCQRVQTEHPWIAAVFRGDESPAESLRLLGIADHEIPDTLQAGTAYDTRRMTFAEALVRTGDHLGIQPVQRDYPGFGERGDTLVARVAHGAAHGLPPVLRANVGPFLEDRREAVSLFLHWTRELARSGMLDVLSIGTSQLTQEAFGEPWDDRPNGGGVPLNSVQELAQVWSAARPMLVRTYAGTRHMAKLARIHEQTLDIAWHALSLWWFCQADGRGPNPVRLNLAEHLDTLQVIAASGKPFEPNVPHHFAFRGADDVSYVLSGFLAAQAAKAAGVSTLVLQVMLNTPKHTWGIQDLAKARALVRLTRELEDDSFRVLLQPRGGLDYFSPDEHRARVQLAAVSALMDDIEPERVSSPPVIHVVSYSEANRLADPAVVIESCQLTRHALSEYRALKARGLLPDLRRDPEVEARTQHLVAEAEVLLTDMRRHLPDLTTAEGLYRVMADGYFPLPQLWACREEFAAATAWRTQFLNGGVQVVDAEGRPVSARTRVEALAEGRRHVART